MRRAGRIGIAERWPELAEAVAKVADEAAKELAPKESELREASETASAILEEVTGGPRGGRIERSPGRRETAKLCAGRPYREATYTMRGNVPRVLEEDKEFWLLFQQSKQLEKALADARARKRTEPGVVQLLQDDFNACINKVRARLAQLVPEDRAQ